MMMSSTLSNPVWREYEQ